MKENSIARRYALGYIKALKDDKEYQKVHKELNTFQSLLSMNDDLRMGLQTFLFNKRQKEDLITTIKEYMKMNPKTVKFILTLIEENRLTILDQIIQSMEEIWNKINNIQSLVVHSALPLSKNLEQKLIRNLESAFKKKILLKTNVDKSLIAGLKIQKGSIYYDFSIAGNLIKLKNALIEE